MTDTQLLFYRNVIYYLGHAMQKRVFGHMQQQKPWSDQICSVWSRPSLSTNRINRYYRMNEWRAKAQTILCTGWSESMQSAHVLRHFFIWCGPPDVISETPVRTLLHYLKDKWITWCNNFWDTKFLNQRHTLVEQYWVFFSQHSHISM